MKNLFNKLTKKVILPLVVSVTFAFNSYSQKIEKTENGFKQYNEKGQIIGEKIKKGSQIDLLEFEYDKRGRKVKEIFKRTYENYKKFYDIEQSNFKYDEQGRIIERINTEDYTDNYGANDNEEYEKIHWVEKWIYKYNKQGVRVESKLFTDLDGDGLIDKSSGLIYKF